MISKNDFMLCGNIRESGLITLRGEWKANIKFDGERALMFKEKGEVFLVNRRGKIINSHFAEIVEDLKKIPDGFVLDGEIISYDDDFTKLQRRALTTNGIKQGFLIKEIPCYFMVFDILKTSDMDLRYMSLKQRIKIRDSLIIFDNFDWVEKVEYGEILRVLDDAKNTNREGIIIKEMNSPYEHKRSKSWLKLKFFKETELKVTGYTENPKGIRATDDREIAVQIAGSQHKKVKDEIDKKGYCDIVIQYLEETKDNRYRFISFKGVKV